MTLGGRVSEELHFDTITSGASDDFNKVTRMASAMVTKWGMSKSIGTLYFDDDEQKLQKPFSEETARRIDSEVRRIIDEAYERCKELLTAKKAEIGLIAEELLSKEVLGREDMIRILGKRYCTNLFPLSSSPPTAIPVIPEKLIPGKRPFDDHKDFEKFFDKGHTSSPP